MEEGGMYLQHCALLVGQCTLCDFFLCLSLFFAVLQFVTNYLKKWIE
jgi:hypothetical protein